MESRMRGLLDWPDKIINNILNLIYRYGKIINDWL